MNSLKKIQKPMILEIIQIFSAHPFILTALACFFCVSVSSANISAVSTFIPSAVLCFCGIVGAAAVSYRSPKKSKKPVMVYLSGTAVAFSLIFAFMLTESSKPQLVILNTGMVLVLAAAVYLICIKKLTTRRLIILMFILGFLLRLAYIVTVSISTKQHDVGSLEKMNGHLGYIGYLVYNGSLPDIDVREVYQYYHPPLHHILAAIWVRIQHLIGIDNENIWENIQILTLFYSCLCMILSYKIFRALGLDGKGLATAFAVVAFCPTFYILGGSINNDILSVTFLLGAALNTLYWYKSRNMGRVICIAVCIGCGMMTKLSVWMAAPAVAFIFIYVFFKNIKEWKRWLGQYAAFLGICAPLGLWWGIRNYITHGVPITYVMKLSDSSSQYIGNIPVMERIFDFSPSQFADVGDQFTMYDGAYNEYNPLVALFKTSMFDELFTVRFYPEIAGFNKILFWSAVILGIVGFISMLYSFCCKKTLSGVHKIFIGILYVVIFVSYYAFCIQFPHVCTENIRYAVPLIVIGAFFAGSAIRDLETCQKPKLKIPCIAVSNALLTVTALYSISSIIVYEKIFIK